MGNDCSPETQPAKKVKYRLLNNVDRRAWKFLKLSFILHNQCVKSYGEFDNWHLQIFLFILQHEALTITSGVFERWPNF